MSDATAALLLAEVQQLRKREGIAGAHTRHPSDLDRSSGVGGDCRQVIPNGSALARTGRLSRGIVAPEWQPLPVPPHQRPGRHREPPEASTMKCKELPAVEELRQKFDYKDGVLLHREGFRSGLPAGRVNKGRRSVWLLDSWFQASRVIWALHHGEDPGEQLIDHKDRDPLNNRIENLRLADHQLNSFNAAYPSTRGFPKGVSEDPRHPGRYQARIQVNGQLKGLGTYSTVDEAAAAYRGAALLVAGEFTCLEQG